MRAAVVMVRRVSDVAVVAVVTIVVVVVVVVVGNGSGSASGGAKRGTMELVAS